MIIATDNNNLNKEILQDVDHAKQFVNVVDEPDLSTFIVPAHLDRGHLQIAISINGASPGLAKKIQKELEQIYGKEYIEYTKFLAEMRKWILKQDFNQDNRKKLFAKLIEDDIFQRIIAGE